MIWTSLAVGAGLLQSTAGLLIAASLMKKSPRQAGALPRISIVVPARNEADNLPRLFASFAKLRYDADKIEIIVVNDDSTDETRIVAEKLGAGLPFPVKIVDANHGENEVLPQTKTLPLAQGIDVATGEFILMTDGDCEIQGDWALDMVRHFEPDIGLVCGITLPDYEQSSNKVTRFEDG